MVVSLMSINVRAEVSAAAVPDAPKNMKEDVALAMLGTVVEAIDDSNVTMLYQAGVSYYCFKKGSASPEPWTKAYYYGMSALYAYQTTQTYNATKKSGRALPTLAGSGDCAVDPAACVDGQGNGDGTVPGSADGAGQPSTDNTTASSALAQVDAVKRNLAKAGFSITEDGKITDSKGNSYGAGSGFGTSSDLKKRGVSKKVLADIKGHQKALAKKLFKSKSRVSAVALSSGGGGGYSASSHSRKRGYSPSYGMFGVKTKRKVASVVGKTKNHNGDSIGVAGDDIFKMLHRVYNKKRNTGFFIGSN